MKVATILSTLTLLSVSAFADVDYSRCNAGFSLMGVGLDNDGKLMIYPGQKISSKTTEGKVEKYIIETEAGANPVFGSRILPGYQHEITLERDEQGRVVKVSTGGDKIDKKSLEQREQFGLQMQVSNAVMSATMWNHGNQSGHNLPGFEPLYSVTSDDGKISYKQLSQLSKAERKQVGLSEDLYSELTKKWRRDKKSVAKIERGLKELKGKTKPIYQIGQEAEFEISEGVCTPKVFSNRYFDSANGSISLKPYFTKAACEEVAKLHLKHRDNIAKCDEANGTISHDLLKSYEKIRELYSGIGIGPGMGGGLVGGSGGGGGMGGHGFHNSPLSLLKTTCDVMLGVYGGFGIGNGSAPAEEAASSNPQ